MKHDTANPYQPEKAQTASPSSVHLVYRHEKHHIVRVGFCWSGFFLPTLWAASEGLWRIAALSTVVFAMPSIKNLLMDYSDASGNENIAFAAAILSIASYLFYLGMMIYIGLRGQQLIVENLLAHGYVVESTPVAMDNDNLMQ